MKIFVMHVPGATRAQLFSDERLENLRRLMDMGCFGELEGNPAEWNILARHETHTLTLGEFLVQAGKDVATFDDIAALQAKLGSGNWDCCQWTASFRPDSTQAFQAGSGSADPSLDFDRNLGDSLQYLSDDTLLAVVGENCFVLVAGNNPVTGYQDGSTLDLTPTILELAGYPLPDATEGRSWVAGMELNNASGLTEDEQTILRERLSGLGYI
jgi:hypothetical protein